MSDKNLLVDVSKQLSENINNTVSDNNKTINLIVEELEFFDEIINNIPVNEALLVANEVQNDLLNSLIFATQGFYRNSYMCLRSSIELLLSFIYYYDHYYDYVLWKNDHIDMTWAKLISTEKGVLNKKYIQTLTGLRIDTAELSKKICDLYHETSQSVHGKHSYTQTAISSSILYINIEFSKYTTIFNEVIAIQKIMLYIRFYRELEANLDTIELDGLNKLLRGFKDNE